MTDLRQSLPQSADIVIVGGGPAGSTAATLLARAGYDVVLVDRQHHPRETVGESLLPSVWKYFDLLGVTPAIEREGFVKKAGGVVVWGDEINEIAFKDFAYTRPGLHVERGPFDRVLLDNSRAAGARVIEGVRAVSATFAGDAAAEVALIETAGGARGTIACRLLLDASGQASLLARQFDCRQLDPDFRFVSLWGYFRGSRFVSPGGLIRPFEAIASHPPMTFVTRLGGWGWSWHIPLRHNTSVGIVVPVEDYRVEAATYGSLEEYFLAVCRRTPHLATLLDEAQLEPGVRMIKDFSYLSSRVAGPGYFVLGDAAGFVDPIFSLGVVLAIYSGRLSAWAAERILKRPAQAAATRALFERQLLGRYALARTMALPGVTGEAPDDAKTWFNFFSHAEQDLMWSAASLTTRSDNMVRAAGVETETRVLKRRTLVALQPA